MRRPSELGSRGRVRRTRASTAPMPPLPAIAAAPRTSLPGAPRRFVGRGTDLASLDDAVRPGALVTLRGPGGMGKTTLALAWMHRARFAEKVFVDLSAERGEAGLRASFARAFDLPTAATIDMLRAQLDARAGALIVVDNAESVLSEVALLLGPPSAAAFVVTSREPLGVARERVHVLLPIELADAPDPDAIAKSDAFRLLREAVVERRGSWSPGSAELLAAGELCRRLDGIPLALELAAARLAALDTSELLSRLGAGVDVLGRGPRDAHDRHQTLSAAIEGSLRTLSPAEREVLDVCSVFAAPFDAAAVEAALGRTAVAELEALHDKSLLRAAAPGASGTHRLALYDTVQQVTRARLSAELERAALERSAAYFAGAALPVADALDGPEGGHAWLRLHELGPHLGRSLDFVLGAARPRDAAVAAHLVRAHAPVLQANGGGERLLALIAQVLTSYSKLSARERTLLLERRAHALYVLGRRDEGSIASDEAIAAARALRDKALEGRLRCSQARMRLLPAREAIEALESVLSFLRGHGHARERALAANDLACRHSELGAHGRAEQLFLESMAGFREAGDVRSLGTTACQLAILAIERGRLGEARAALSEAEALAPKALGWSLDAMIAQARAHALHAEGDLSGAVVAYEAVERRYAQLASRFYVAIFRGYRGIVLRELGQVRDAEHQLASAIYDLRAIGESHHRALFLAHLAALARRDGRDDVADEALRDGQRASERSGAAGLTLALALAEAERHLRQVRTLVAEHDVRAAEAARRLALRTIDEAVAAAPANGFDARIAERIARQALSATHAPALAHVASPAHAGSPAHGPSHSPSSPATGLVVQADARWFQLPGKEQVGLGSQALLRRLLLQLAEARLTRPGEPMPVATLVQAGWPGEQMRESSAKNRLQVAISSLRKLGLEQLLEREGDGYRLDPSMPLEIRR